MIIPHNSGSTYNHLFPVLNHLYSAGSFCIYPVITVHFFPAFLMIFFLLCQIADFFLHLFPEAVPAPAFLENYASTLHILQINNNPPHNRSCSVLFQNRHLLYLIFHYLIFRYLVFLYLIFLYVQLHLTDRYVSLLLQYPQSLTLSPLLFLFVFLSVCALFLIFISVL